MQDETWRSLQAYSKRMTFNPRFWHPAALVLSALNLVGVGQAAGAAEPLHAGVHAVLALALWAWAQRLRQRGSGGAELPRFDALELEVGELDGSSRRPRSGWTSPSGCWRRAGWSRGTG